MSMISSPTARSFETREHVSVTNRRSSANLHTRGAKRPPKIGIYHELTCVSHNSETILEYRDEKPTERSNANAIYSASMSSHGRSVRFLLGE